MRHEKRRVNGPSHSLYIMKRSATAVAGLPAIHDAPGPQSMVAGIRTKEGHSVPWGKHILVSGSVKASLGRVRDRKFTEADVRTIIIEMRELSGPLIREVGDLIAHPKRDRGVTFSYLIHCLSRMTMFVKYQGTDKIPIPSDGTCDWWLQDYLLAQADDFEDREIKRALSVKRKQIKREIKSYFPPTQFPQQLAKPNDQRFWEIVALLTTKIVSKPAFPHETIAKEIKSLLENLGIEASADLVDDFVVCICLLFHRSSFDLPHGSKGNCELGLEPHEPEPFVRDGEESAILTPHGDFQVNAIADIAHGDKPIRVAFPLITTRLSSERYVSDALVQTGEQGFRYINLKGDLQFVRSEDKPLASA